MGLNLWGSSTPSDLGWVSIRSHWNPLEPLEIGPTVQQFAELFFYEVPWVMEKLEVKPYGLGPFSKVIYCISSSIYWISIGLRKISLCSYEIIAWRCWVIFENFCLLSTVSFIMTCLKWLTRSSSIHYMVSAYLPSISLSLWIFDRCMFWITKLLNNFVLQSHSWSHWFLDLWFLCMSSFLSIKDI